MLGHGHADHRGIAAALGVPVLCHEDERADVEGDGGWHYFKLDRIPYRFPRAIYPTLLRHWDGGPAKVAETVSEGDEIAGFVVKHFPGHAPGLIGLWRESDRLALVSDTTYFVDSMKFKPVDWANVPNRVFNQDHDAGDREPPQARGARAAHRRRRPLRADVGRAGARCGCCSNRPRTAAEGPSSDPRCQKRPRAGRNWRLGDQLSDALAVAGDAVLAVGDDPVAAARRSRRGRGVRRGVDPVAAAAAGEPVACPRRRFSWSAALAALDAVVAAAAVDRGRGRRGR